MSARLVGEVANWLTTPVAAPLTTAERLVLVLIAERSNEQTREMWRHRGDTETLAERLARCSGLTQKALGQVLARLSSRGLEARIPLSVDKKGRTVFATRGRATGFRLPELPASVSLPDCEWSVPDGTIPVDEAVDNPVDNHHGEAPSGEERSRPVGTINGNGPFAEGPNGPNGPFLKGPYPYKSFPSQADLPMTPSPLSSRAELEVPPDAPKSDETPEFSDHEYRAAQSCLLGLPDLGAGLLARVSAAAPDTRHEIHVIHAARLASKGTPA